MKRLSIVLALFVLSASAFASPLKKEVYQCVTLDSGTDFRLVFRTTRGTKNRTAHIERDFGRSELNIQSIEMTYSPSTSQYEVHFKGDDNSKEVTMCEFDMRASIQ